MTSPLNNTFYTGFGYTKALIFGEYAVMHGAPGLVTALTPKIRVSLNHIRPVVHPESEEFSAIDITSTEDQLKKFLRIPLSSDDPVMDADIDVDMSDFFDKSGGKLGIGSSSASIVALIQAKVQIRHSLHLPPLSKEAIIQKAIQFHRMAQNQMGSGIDVIASTIGGISLVSNCPVQPEIIRVHPDNIPPFVVLATHQQAPTISYISAAQKVENTQSYQSVIQSLTNIYIQLKKQILYNNHSEFLSILDKIVSQLETLSEIIDMPIVPDVFYKLYPIAKNNHVILKTSGAGGGDIFIAFSHQKQYLLDFIKEIPKDTGITILPFDIAPVRYD